MNHLAEGGGGVGQHGHFAVALCLLRQRGVGHAVLRHHSAQQKRVDALRGELVAERRFLERVGKLFGDDGRVWCCGQNLGMDIGAGRACVEEGCCAVRMHHMLDMDDSNAGVGRRCGRPGC